MAQAHRRTVTTLFVAWLAVGTLIGKTSLIRTMAAAGLTIALVTAMVPAIVVLVRAHRQRRARHRAIPRARVVR